MTSMTKTHAACAEKDSQSSVRLPLLKLSWMLSDSEEYLVIPKWLGIQRKRTLQMIKHRKANKLLIKRKIWDACS